MTEFLKIESAELSASISPYGAALARVFLSGHNTSLVLGLEAPEDYQNAPSAIGVVIAPIAGRIAQASAPLGDRVLSLDPNTPPDTLHSGRDAAQHQKWEVTKHLANEITLQLNMSNGVCGLPGNRCFEATYRIEGSSLAISLETVSDADTLVNVTSHAYWVLDDSSCLDQHTLSLPTARMLEATDRLIPTGTIVDCTGGNFDFTKGACPVAGKPLDGCFCLRDNSVSDLQETLSLTSKRSGISLDVTSTEPGVVLYTGSGLPAFETPMGTPKIAPFSAIAIEAQKWPDAPNHLNFPSIVLKKGIKSKQMTRFFVSRSHN